MNQGKFYIEGELYLSLEVVAEIYRVRSVWMREVYDSGLLGAGQEPASIAATALDRVATIVRMHVGLGLDLDQIGATLEDGAFGL